MVSVIIPAYNIADFVGRCINSVCAQSYSELEIIIIDDGSTDRTPEILDEFESRDSRIKVVHKKNEGVSVARNTGINLSLGEYIFFFDGDDFLETDTVETMVNLAKHTGSDAVIYGYHRYLDNQIVDTLIPRFEKDVYEGTEIIEKIVPRYIGFSLDALNGFVNREDGAMYVENPALWHMMCRGDIIRDNNIKFVPGMKIGEDTIFSTEYLSYTQKVCIHKKAYYYIVSRNNSAIGSYKNNAKAKLDSKLLLLKERQAVTERIKARTGYDISEAWKGTVVMSAMELAFLYGNTKSEMKAKERFKEWCSYSRLPEVKSIIKAYHPRGKSIVLKVPFLFLKWGWYRVLFLACEVLSLVGYSYDRDAMMEGKK